MPAARRNPLISFLLSFITPGLGQLYNGQPQKGAFYLVAGYLLTLGLARSGLARTFPGLAALLLFALALSLVISGEAFLTAARRRAAELTRFNRWYVYLAGVLLGVLVARPPVLLAPKASGVQFYRLGSETMEPALREGELVAGETAPYRQKKPARGDVVIFAYPADPSREFIKRVVGLEGETVALSGGKVYVNGRPLAEPWGTGGRPAPPGGRRAPDTMAAVKVPEGHLFVLGDNRDISFDSRFYGPVETGRVRARALYVAWSKERGRIGKTIGR